MSNPSFRPAAASLVTGGQALRALKGPFSLCLAATLVLWLGDVVRGTPPAVDQQGDPLPVGAVARLGTVRLRHPQMIFALAYSPDGKVLVGAAGDFASVRGGLGWSHQVGGSLRFWDPTTGKELRRLAIHEGPIRSLMFSADGKVLMSMQDGMGPKLWDPATGKEIDAPARRSGDCAALSADGTALAVGSRGMVSVFDIASAKEVRRLEMAKAYISAVAFSPDGKTVAGVFYLDKTDRGVCLWDVATGRALLKLPPESASGHSLAFAPDGKTLATVSYDQPARLWDVATGKEIRALGDPGEFIPYVAFSHDGKALLVVRSGGTVLWEVATGKVIRRFGEKRQFHHAGALAPDGKTVALSDDRAVRFFDVGTGKERLPSTAHVSAIEAVAFGPDGKTALTGGDGLLLWDITTGKQLATLGSSSQVGAAAFMRDGKAVVAGYHYEETIRLWETATGRELRRFEGKPGAVEFIGLLADGKSLVSMSRYRTTRGPNFAQQGGDKGLPVWDVATGKELRVVGDESWHRATSSSDGRTVAAGSRQIHVWDAASGRERARLGEPDRSGFLFALALSPDGRRLVSSTLDTPIRVWEAATGTEMRQFAGPHSAILALAVSPDGRVIAGGISDGTVRLWDLETIKELCKLEGHQGPVVAVAFSADGRRLISGSHDTTALIWDVAGVLPAAPAARLAPAELKESWAALAAADGAAALKAVRRLALSPEQALPFIRDSLSKQPVVDADRLARLVANLDADDFEKREAAGAELARQGQLAEPALRRVLQGKPSAELRMRAEALLKNLDSRLPPAALQAVRVLEVLELIATPDARKVIESLAKQSAGTPIAEEAKAALARLAGREGDR